MAFYVFFKYVNRRFDQVIIPFLWTFNNIAEQFGQSKEGLVVLVNDVHSNRQVWGPPIGCSFLFSAFSHMRHLEDQKTNRNSCNLFSVKLAQEF
ncbi:protein of unknown function [Magnetospirillum sp. XM-1]|nr:protein of unknown function [Magnetospirillum sp. XM-1]